jgi:colicin import membrane protein
LIIYLMTVNWSGSEREIVRSKPAPKVINARLVDVSEFRPKSKPKPKAAPKAKTKPVVKAKPKPKPKPKPVVKPKAAPKPKPVVKEQAKPEPRITEQELAAIARADLARAVAEEEQAAEATATAAEMAASYASLIQQTVINYWSRPPSARNGMEALLAIQLIPTGEVVSVSVLKSSGNTAFDRSAMNAGEKAGSFPELQQLPAGEFEKTFRRFRLLFRPEDLRY